MDPGVVENQKVTRRQRPARDEVHNGVEERPRVVAFDGGIPGVREVERPRTSDVGQLHRKNISSIGKDYEGA